MTDYIKAAVELADGYEWRGDAETLGGDKKPFVGMPYGVLSVSFKYLCRTPAHLDALAAQLVRQVDANEFAGFKIEPNGTYVAFDDDAEGYAHGPDRTMNTIKAIVDSGVLK